VKYGINFPIDIVPLFATKPKKFRKHMINLNIVDDSDSPKYDFDYSITYRTKSVEERVIRNYCHSSIQFFLIYFTRLTEKVSLVRFITARASKEQK